jgi:hypothetical protein
MAEIQEFDPADPAIQGAFEQLSKLEVDFAKVELDARKFQPS